MKWAGDTQSMKGKCLARRERGRDMRQNEATEVLRVLREVVCDCEFARTVVELASINSPDRMESDRLDLKTMYARWNYGNRH